MFLQKSMPVRIKALHYYKAGFFFRLLMAFSRPFLPKKVQERVSYNINIYIVRLIFKNIKVVCMSVSKSNMEATAVCIFHLKF